MIEKDAFIEDLEAIERKLKFVTPRLKLLRIAYEGRNEALYPETLKIQTALENVAVKARNLPYFTWRTTARDDVRKVMMETIPHKIGFTKEGWFSVRIPMLLPKKNSGSTEYMRTLMYSILGEFFQDKEWVRFPRSVIIYRHVYSEEYPSIRKRDHDNIEVNQVTDTLALFLLADDNPNVCNHYHTSAIGSENRTEVYIVPQVEFIEWLEREGHMPKEGIELHETLQ